MACEVFWFLKDLNLVFTTDMFSEKVDIYDMIMRDNHKSQMKMKYGKGSFCYYGAHL